ncbi:unnamed protein product [Sympodiomycopsis kandeliae]
MFTLKSSFVLTALVAVSSAQAALITVKNNCPFTIWPGVYSNPNYPQATGVGGEGGFQMNSQDTVSFGVPDNWNSARIWGRRNCDFSKQDVSACDVGSCIGGLKCTQPGIPPVTVAEWTLVPGGQDNYDVSNVDGSNLPMTITPSDPSCAAPSCPVDLNANCPSDLAVRDANGAIIGCYSSCKKYGRPQDCCTGDHNTAETCPQSGVDRYSYFHDNCPQAYAYAYDEHNGVLKTCNRNGQSPDYTLTFCP